MLRIDSHFAMASVALSALGLLSAHVLPDRGLVWNGWGSRVAYGFALQTPCYGMAALFGAMAFLYSLPYIPFNKTLAQWHFWLSFGSVALCVAGVMVFFILTRKEPPPRLGLSATFFFVSVLASMPVFVAAQLWFAIGLTRAILRMRQS